MLDKISILFLDFQTTGPKPETGEILEIAWGAANGSGGHALIKPERTTVSNFIRKMTGIKEDMLAEAHSLAQAIERLQAFIQSSPPDVVVIHYAKFEQPFLEELETKLNFKLECPILCTHQVAKRLYPNLPARGLAGLAGYFGWSMKEVKRGADQIAATRAIWHGLIPQLSAVGITELQALQDWLKNTVPAKKTKYEYPLEKDKRLNMPKKPGIYRMLGKTGEVLYVGKATNLRDRVNSYFRGQKKRNSFKLQMLAQVWDINVTVCDSALEAALLESDEIKKWNPRYNVALKAGERKLAFYSRDFQSVHPLCDHVHIIGPFPSQHVLVSLIRLAQSISMNSENPDLPEDLLFETIDRQILIEGFRLFCEINLIRASQLRSARSILYFGMKWHKEQLKLDALESDEAVDDEQEKEEVETAEEMADAEYTVEEIAGKFRSLFQNSAAALRRSRKLTKLLNCEMDIKDADEKIIKTLYVRGGIVLDSPASVVDGRAAWGEGSVSMYDRVSVLHAELKRLSIKFR